MYNTNTICSTKLTRNLFAVLFLLALGGPLIAHAEDCVHVTRLDLNTTTERFGLFGSETEMFEVDVPRRGILTFSSMAPLAASVDLKLGLFDASCQPATGVDGGKLITRLTSEIALYVESPGLYLFGVAIQDPSESLDTFKVSAHFTDLSEIDPELAQAEDEIDPELAQAEDEIDPELAQAEDEIDPELAQAEDEIDPELMRIAPGTLLGDTQLGDTPDDHADTLLFASPLHVGRQLTAVLSNHPTDDSDTFTFILDEQVTVRIDLHGNHGVLAEIYDTHGQAIETLGNDSTTFKTLAAGRYFVRVEGQIGTTGSYRVSVAVSGW